MFTTMTAQLSTPTLLRLIEYLHTRSPSKDVSEAINTALEFWLDAKNDVAPGADTTDMRGYQWKSLFLPEGTILRSWSYGEHNYARVEGDAIIHEGRSVSPNEFARHFARSARNAWFDLSIRRPGDKQYKMAAILRKELARQRPDDGRAPAANASGNTSADTANPETPGDPAPGIGKPTMTSAIERPGDARMVAPIETPPVCSKCPAQSGRNEPVQKSDFDPGWDLPERRKFRYRLQDIAF